MPQATDSSTIHDVVIIGSGAGGGTATKVLADLGVKVLLMEAGPMVSMSDFKMLQGPYGGVLHRQDDGGRASGAVPQEAIDHVLKRSSL
jgi:choline dehydrogenase-like flavoprotein